jgi:2-keto-4-pentenoate hydratase/2-oxohepta-3-ene-1,7-dioic acid hydratase in catechol pathway
MGLQIVRFERQNNVQWGVVNEDRIHALKGTYELLADFLNEGVTEARNIKEQDDVEILSFNEVTILSPVTQPARIVCQGANYSAHRAEAGLAAERPPFNMIFSKADSSLTGAYSEIVRPSHVKLLDYEIELGLVIGKDISEPIQVTDENLHEYVAGLVLVNDVSARDVQLPEGQWLKGKSYRTFCPTVPFLFLLDREDVPHIHNLDLKLWVNDELRQSANTSQMLYKPAETLTELSGVMDFSKGDLIITGTAGGVALNVSKEVMDQILNLFVPGQRKMELLIDSQLENERYLKDGDLIRCEIKSPDGRISLGEQSNKVVASYVKIS